MVKSMTAFATQNGVAEGFSWVWDIRSVNGKGLDLRLRVPDWIEGLEGQARAVLGKALKRGSVTVGLRLSRDETATGLALDNVHLAKVLDAIAQIETASQDHHVALAPPTAADILSIRGVQETGAGQIDGSVLIKPLITDLGIALEAFIAMRATEGAALRAVINGQLDQVETLVESSVVATKDRSEAQKENLKAALARVMDNTDGVDPQRVAQELAILAVKSDITEEVDRLRAHVAATRDLLAAKEATGRKLDFICQEFNREANTLCSKAGSAALTGIGLDLKAVIDQMREQIQNIE